MPEFCGVVWDPCIIDKFAIRKSVSYIGGLSIYVKIRN